MVAGEGSKVDLKEQVSGIIHTKFGFVPCTVSTKTRVYNLNFKVYVVRGKTLQASQLHCLFCRCHRSAVDITPGSFPCAVVSKNVSVKE